MERNKKQNSHNKSNSFDFSIINKHGNQSLLSSNSALLVKSSLIKGKGTNDTTTFAESSRNKYVIKDNSIPYDDYKKSMKVIMDDYKYEGDPNIKRADKRHGAVVTDEVDKGALKKVMRHHKNKSMTSVAHEDSLIRVSVSNEEYRNPFQSYEVIKKNQAIFQSMIHNYKEREIKKLEETFKSLKEIQVKVPDVKKIKVTSLMPKNLEILTSNNNNMIKNENPGVVLPPMSYLNYNKESSSTDMYGYYIYSSKNFPEGREQFSWSKDGSDFLLFGGIVSNKTNYIWNLDPVNLEWKKIIAEGIPANLRYGHTAVLYQRKLYVFGGKTKVNNYPYIPDLEVFSLDDRTWANPVLYTKSILKVRRNHVAKIIGHQMLIHGGISEDDEYLNDCYLLSFSPLKWLSVSINTDDEPSPTLAWHTCCLVLPSDQMYSAKLSIYKLPDQNIGRRSISKIKEKGLYFFGGKSSEEGPLKNDVWILKIGKKPLEWIKLTTNGNPPIPRYAHSMNFYEEGNYLIIHGGRNDSYSDSFALNDTYLLELSRFDWIQVNINFDLKQVHVYNRCGHSSVIYSKVNL